MPFFVLFPNKNSDVRGLSPCVPAGTAAKYKRIPDVAVRYGVGTNRSPAGEATGKAVVTPLKAVERNNGSG